MPLSLRNYCCWTSLLYNMYQDKKWVPPPVSSLAVQYNIHRIGYIHQDPVYLHTAVWFRADSFSLLRRGAPRCCGGILVPSQQVDVRSWQLVSGILRDETVEHPDTQRGQLISPRACPAARRCIYVTMPTLPPRTATTSPKEKARYVV